MNFKNFKARLKEQIEPPKNNDFSEVHYSKTPNGGDYSVAYFYDKEGNPCKKEDASYLNIIEYTKDGRRINETYGFIS